jgi:hypothetical protein
LTFSRQQRILLKRYPLEKAMDALIEAGILDLGGVGKAALEIEYNSGDKFREAFYRLPTICQGRKVSAALLSHDTLSIRFADLPAFHIPLPDTCDGLIEVRLPVAFGGENITELIVRD